MKMADDNSHLDLVKEFLKLREDNFKSFVNLVMDNFHNRLDKLSREVQNIKDSLQFTQNEFDETKDKMKNTSKLVI